MKGSAARLLCAAVLVAAATETLAEKPKKNFKKFPPPGPPFPFGGVPPFRLAPVTQAPSTLDPYACLPKYLCIIKNKKGEKRTTIVHGLHPALRKAKPNVIDPATLPKLPGGKKPFPIPQVVAGSSDDELYYRDREFNDSFLKQQEMAEAMALLEEKRRQFLYLQGKPKQKIIPKGGEKVRDPENDDEDEEKSQEVSKEEKEDETDKSPEISKEEESAEESSAENAKSRSKLSKYKIKKKLRNSAFKARIDDYEDVDALNDHLATVPWDDRLRNDSDPLKPSEIYDKLFGKVLPAFQLPSLPKIAKSIPGISFLTSGSVEKTTTTTQRPGLFKRMLKRVTGGGASASPAPTIRRRNGGPVRRYKRDAEENLKLISEDMKIVKQIKDPARQCRMIFKGCDLPYDHIMKMVSTGQVLIERDFDVPTTPKPVPADPAFAQDDEMEQALKDKMQQKNKSPKPIPQMLAQASLGGKKKVNGLGGLPIFGKNKKKPMIGGSSEEFSDHFRPKNKKHVASLPLMPMRYQWGKPTYSVNGRPTKGISEFSGGIVERSTFKPSPPPTTTTTTTERPIFAASPLDIRDNLTAPPLQHSVIKVNKTHAVHVLSKKPYNPPKTKTRDAKGQPVSFSSVFTEIAGNTGGIHDFFDRISGAFGGDGTRKSARDLSSTFPGSESDVHGNSEKYPASPHAKPTAFPSAPMPPDHIVNKEEEGQSAERDEEDSGSEEDQEENEEENNEEEGNNDEGNNEEENVEEENNDEENNEEEPENEEEQDDDEDGADNEDAADDLENQASPDKQSQKKPVLQVNQPDNSQSQEQQVELPSQNNKKKPANGKQPAQSEKDEENEESEEEENDENENGELDLPDNIPPFIRQSMIEDYKRKQQEKLLGGSKNGGRPGQGSGQHGGAGRPGQGQQGGYQQQYGGSGQGQKPQGAGGFLSSLFSG